MKRSLLRVLATCAPTIAIVYAGLPLAAQTAISADGTVESTTGGFKFPDETVQATGHPPLLVVDSNENPVGPVLSVQPPGGATVIFEALDGHKLQVFVLPTALQPTTTLVYETSDCTGTAYIEEVQWWFPQSAQRGSTFYRPMPATSGVAITKIGYWDWNEEMCVDLSCCPQSVSGITVEAVPGGISFVPAFSLRGGAIR